MAVVPAVRLTFATAGGEARLVGCTRFQTTPMAPDPVADYRGRSGHWFEVQDAGGAPVFGERIGDPLPDHVEALHDDGAAHWAPRARVSESFQLVAPLVAGAAQIVVYSSSAAETRDHAAVEVARVAVKDLPS